MAELAVVASPDEMRGEIVKAYVILAPGYTASPELASELQGHVRTVTAPYKYPREIEFVESLPKTISGKIRRVELRERQRRRTGSLGKATRPIVSAAFDRRLSVLDDRVLTLAIKLDAGALYTVGCFLLWDLNDPAGARPYLEGASARGNIGAMIDLLVLTLFKT